MRSTCYPLLAAAALALPAAPALAQNALVAGPRLSTPAAGPEGGAVSITHNASLALEAAGVVCYSQAGGYTVDNTYWRVFPLAGFPEITQFFSVESVDIGIRPFTAGKGGLVTDLRLYRMEGGVDFATTFPLSAVTLVSEVEHVVHATDAPAVYNVPIPDSPDFARTDTLVVAWYTPAGSTTVPPADVRMGVNDDGETGATYLQAPGCDHPIPVAVGSIGHPTSQWIVQVNGTLTPVANEPGSAPPAAVTLGRIAPNPMASTATVAFTVHEPAHVRLAVYDVLGREVAVLADGAYPVGTHTASFDASAHAGGTYLYRLEAGSAVQTRATTVVK